MFHLEMLISHPLNTQNKELNLTTKHAEITKAPVSLNFLFRRPIT